MVIAQVLAIIILQSLNLAHILSSFIKILIQYFFSHKSADRFPICSVKHNSHPHLV